MLLIIPATAREQTVIQGGLYGILTYPCTILTLNLNLDIPICSYLKPTNVTSSMEKIVLCELGLCCVDYWRDETRFTQRCICGQEVGGVPRENSYVIHTFVK